MTMDWTLRNTLGFTAHLCFVLHHTKEPGIPYLQCLHLTSSVIMHSWRTARSSQHCPEPALFRQFIFFSKKKRKKESTPHPMQTDGNWASGCRLGQKVINSRKHSWTRFSIFPKRRKGNIAKKTHIIHYSTTNYVYPITQMRIIVQRDTNTVEFRHTFFGTGGFQKLIK